MYVVISNLGTFTLEVARHVRLTRCAQGQYEKQGKDVQWSVVVSLAAFGLALGPAAIIVLLSSEQFRVEDMRRYFRKAYVTMTWSVYERHSQQNKQPCPTC